MRTILHFLFISLSSAVYSQPKLDTLFKNAGVTGVQIQHIRKGKSYDYTYGFAKAGEAKKIMASSVFQAASLSKPVLAYISLRLADRKIIHLDTPLYHYYKYDRIKKDTAAQRITTRMVLYHLTGLPNWASNPLSKAWSTSPLETKIYPGTQWSYSGEGFMFLQFAIETLMKQSLEVIAKKEVFIPLKMRSSSFLWNSSFEDTGVFGHDTNGDLTGRTEFFLPAGAYSLLTTAADYSQFVQALIRGKGLSKQARQILIHNNVSVSPNGIDSSEAQKHVSWGPGFGIQLNEKGKALWHWGDNGDFKSFFIANPGTKESLVYFSNSEKGLTVMDGVLSYFLGSQEWWLLKWLKDAFK